MLRVEINFPSGCTWKDHVGNAFEKLVFSKEWQSSYTPGHYPLESLGSLYRNIDDIRESPMQSRTDWEIRVPSVYSTTYGAFSTVDLIHWLESENENSCSLIGCEAVLLGDEPVYIGVVESVSGGGQTTALRISDRLGNPKAGRREFPTPIGLAAPEKWPVKATKSAHRIDLKISSEPLESKPSFYMKTESGFEGIENWNNFKIAYSPGFTTAVLTCHAGASGSVLAEDLSYDSDVHLSLLNVAGNPARHALRPNNDKDVPDYYSIGDIDNFEVVEVWSRSQWAEIGSAAAEYFSAGRAEHSKRSPHGKGERLNKLLDLEEGTVFAKLGTSYAESLVLNHDNGALPPYQMGNPSQLAFNSREGRADFEHCPRIRIFNLPENLDYLVKPICKFTVNMSSLGYADGVASEPYLKLALKYESKGSFKYIAKFRPAGTSNWTDLPPSMNGDIVTRYIVNSSSKLSSLRKIEFEFYLQYSQARHPTLAEVLEIGDIQIGHVSLTCKAFVPLDISKLYAGGQLQSLPPSPDDIAEGKSVRSALEGLLSLAGVTGFSVSGGSNGLEYGASIGGEPFALRDKMRSLAAESAMLVKLDAAGKKIMAENISLMEDPKIVELPLDAFVLENNFCNFKMESPDRSELLSGISIRWGKDTETGEYAHTLSVSHWGLLKDGMEGEGWIPEEKWSAVFRHMGENIGFGVDKTIDSEWVASWTAAENMAYNLLRWNTAPMRKAQAACIYTVLEGLPDGTPDIGAFVRFELPGYHGRLAKTAWLVTGRHDDLDSMVSTLELLEARDLPAAPPRRHLLLENSGNMLLESENKIYLEDYHG